MFWRAGPPVSVCGLSTLRVEPSPLLEFLEPECKPIASKSRRYSMEDKEFIATEIKELFEEGVIEPSDPP